MSDERGGAIFEGDGIIRVEFLAVVKISIDCGVSKLELLLKRPGVVVIERFKVFNAL